MNEDSKRGSDTIQPKRKMSGENFLFKRSKKKRSKSIVNKEKGEKEKKRTTIISLKRKKSVRKEAKVEYVDEVVICPIITRNVIGDEEGEKTNVGMLCVYKSLIWVDDSWSVVDVFDGDVIITNFRIQFYDSDSFLKSVPLHMIIMRQEVLEIDKERVLIILTKDYLSFGLTFKTEENLEMFIDEVFVKKIFSARAKSVRTITTKSVPNYLNQYADQFKFSMKKEFIRQGGNKDFWNLMLFNRKKIIIAQMLLSFSDKEIAEHARSRIAQKIMNYQWGEWNKKKKKSFYGSVILRCNRADKEHYNATRDNIVLEGTYLSILETGSKSLLIFDTGSEFLNDFPYCDFIFLNISKSDINRICEKTAKLAFSPLDNVSNFMIKYETSDWEALCLRILESVQSIIIEFKKGKSVVIENGEKTEDGVDAVISSLVLLMLDPFYRTIYGFFVLVESQWIRQGFHFSISKRSNMYVIFISILNHLLYTNLSLFEYNEEMLFLLADSVSSPKYNNFLNNRSKESLWHYIQENQLDFFNIFYDEETINTDIIITDYFLFWSKYFLRNNSSLKIDKAFTNSKFSRNSIRVHTISNQYFIPEISSATLHLTESLTFKNNYFQYVNTNFYLLQNLRVLNFDSNQLYLLPDAVSKLSNLNTLSLKNNKLTCLPEKLNKLWKLENLYIDNNKIKNLEESFVNLTNLRSFTLSNNHISYLPRKIYELSKLQVLDLEGNNFPVPYFLFKRLLHVTELNLSNTGQMEISEILCDLVYLQKLNMKNNKICLIPPFLEYLKELNYLDLSNNSLIKVTEKIQKLEHLTYLNLKNNQLIQIAHQIGMCRNLTYLNLKKNRINKLPSSLKNCRKLKYINLQHNQFERIPYPLFFLENIDLLDLSYNNITEITPPAYTLLRSVVKFSLDNNPINLDTEMPSIIGSLWDKLCREIQVNRLKLMVLGDKDVGKSTLVHALTNYWGGAVKNDRIDLGIDITNVLLSKKKKKKKIEVNIWDFSGPDVYLFSHQLFFTDSSVYLIVFKLNDPYKYTHIEFCLNSVKNLTKPHVIICGTHLDQISEEEAVNVLVEVSQKYKKFKIIFKKLSFTAVSGETGDKMEELFIALEDMILKHPRLTEVVPNGFLEVKNLFDLYSQDLVIPVISREELLRFGHTCGFNTEAELSSCTRFLHQVGDILYFESDPELNDTIIISPVWLSSVLGTLFVTKNDLIKEGVLIHNEIAQIWRNFSPELHATLLKLLEKFNISFSLDKEDVSNWMDIEYDKEEIEGLSLIPALLPISKPEKRIQEEWDSLTKTKYSLSRIMTCDFVPLDFFAKLIVRLLYFVQPSTVWSTGIIASRLDTTIYIFMEEGETDSTLEINVKSETSISGYHLFKSILYEILMITQLYNNKWNTFAVAENEYTLQKEYIPMNTIEKAILEGRHSVIIHDVEYYLKDITPDVVMQAYSGIMIPFKTLINKKEIASGNEAKIYLTRWNGDEVVIKEMKEPLKLESLAFHNFRKEVEIHSSMVHENVASLYGISLNPLAIVLEYFPLGDLHSILNDYDTYLSWDFIIRGSLDIVKGLHFLQNYAEYPIVHLDLKTVNVVVNTLDAKSSGPCLKLIDFGCAMYCLSPFMKRYVDNPTYLAPEILKNEPYGSSVDIYGFGIICWEMVSRKDPYLEYTFFGDIERVVVSGKRPMIPFYCDEEYSNLIEHCWDPLPENRPGTDEIIDILSVMQLISEQIEHTYGPLRVFSLNEQKLQIDEDYCVTMFKDTTFFDSLSFKFPKHEIEVTLTLYKQLLSLSSLHLNGVIRIIHNFIIANHEFFYIYNKYRTFNYVHYFKEIEATKELSNQISAVFKILLALRDDIRTLFKLAFQNHSLKITGHDAEYLLRYKSDLVPFREQFIIDHNEFVENNDCEENIVIFFLQVLRDVKSCEREYETWHRAVVIYNKYLVPNSLEKIPLFGERYFKEVETVYNCLNNFENFDVNIFDNILAEIEPEIFSKYSNYYTEKIKNFY